MSILPGASGPRRRTKIKIGREKAQGVVRSGGADESKQRFYSGQNRWRRSAVAHDRKKKIKTFTQGDTVLVDHVGTGIVTDIDEITCSIFVSVQGALAKKYNVDAVHLAPFPYV